MRVLALLAVALVSGCLQGSDCPTASLDETVLATSPNELEQLEGVRSVDVLLISSLEPIEALPQLRCLETVRGDLTVTDAAIVNADGLQSLTSVGGRLGFFNVDELRNFEGLSALQSVGGLHVVHAEKLESFEGLQGVSTIGGSGLVLQDMAAVTQLDGLSGVQEVGDDLLIQGNPALERVTGMSSLRRAIARIGFFSNPALVECDDWALVQQLEYVNQTPELQSDPAACAGP